MSAKPAFLVFAVMSQAALAAGCATVKAPFDHIASGGPTNAASATSDNGDDPKPSKAQKTAEVKIDKKAREAVGHEDILTQMTFWAREQTVHPQDAETAAKFSDALRKGGRPERAVEIASNALDLNPNNPELLRVYALALIDSGRSGEALRPLAALCQTDRKDWRARSAMGVALDEQGRFDEARQTYKEALAIKPDDPGVLTNLGVSYLLTGDAVKAEQLLKQAAALPDAGAETRQNLALAIGLQGRFAEAEQLLKVDLPPAIVANNMAYMHGLLSDDRRWGDLKKTARQ